MIMNAKRFDKSNDSTRAHIRPRMQHSPQSLEKKYQGAQSTVQPPSPPNSQAVTVKQCRTRSPLCIASSILFGALVSAAVASMLVGFLAYRFQSSTSTIMSTSTPVTTQTITTTTVTTTTTTSRTTTTTTQTTTSTTTRTTTTTTQTTTTSSRIITGTGDFIVAIFNTSAGRSTGGFNGTFSSSEDADNAIDSSLGTKYLNYGFSMTSNQAVDAPGVGTGFILTPSRSNGSVATGLQFATANDSPERDPLTVTLEGSTATTFPALNSGASWTLIYNGPTGIDPVSAPSRSTYMVPQNFSNTVAYRSYRLLITSKRSTSNSVQYAEVRIMT